MSFIFLDNFKRNYPKELYTVLSIITREVTFSKDIIYNTIIPIISYVLIAIGAIISVLNFKNKKTIFILSSIIIFLGCIGIIIYPLFFDDIIEYSYDIDIINGSYIIDKIEHRYKFIEYYHTTNNYIYSIVCGSICGGINMFQINYLGQDGRII